MRGRIPNSCGDIITKHALPSSRERQLRALCYAIIILPIDTLLVATQAMASFLTELHARDDARALADRLVPFGEFNALIGATDQMALADRYQQS